MTRANIALAAALLAACASAGKPTATGGRGTVITPITGEAAPDWSEQERAQPAALRNVRRGPEASFHLLRVRTEQKPLIHERSDLVIMTVAGGLSLTVNGRRLPLKPGDVVEIPRGSAYALANGAAQPSVAFLVYTPALDLNDYKPAAAQQARASAWQWNLWLQ